jgi:hypothetical protein
LYLEITRDTQKYFKHRIEVEQLEIKSL